MSKIPTDCERRALNGPTMGTRWSAVFHAPAATDPEPVHNALAEAVDVVDRQMSTWKPDSELMRINRAPTGTWLPVPAELMQVLAKGLEIGQLSDGAFDIGMGDVVSAWGFGPQEADTQAICALLGKARTPAHECLELDSDALRIRKIAPLALDLSGIAKGYAVDQMMKVLHRFGIENALVSLDGELRACGLRSDGRPWTIAVERPDYEARAPLSIIELNDSSVATSGDYRHWVEAGSKRLSHTIDPARGGPLTDAPASVTVLAQTCMEADGWATALMVAGSPKATLLVKKHALMALVIHRDGNALRQTPIGWNQLAGAP
ncbi:FAD:protein FMN transferase [Hoeflea sp.]|uniref:FAD:protein FMN transferase n=1 Tax=Hoeflea sp. TaxID=1940281 RepID=UPI002AFF7280|nr:FAD:protein FMN transferase [Hoeflea sp.]